MAAVLWDSYRKLIYLAVTMLLCLLIAACGISIPAVKYQGRSLDLYSSMQESWSREIMDASDGFVEEVSGFLRLPAPVKPLTVYLFQTHWEMKRYLAQNCPKQSGKRAACFETREKYVIAVSRQSSQKETLQCLRHELTHYVLSSFFYDMPSWVDEGLAQFFECGKPFGQAHDRNVKSLVKIARGPRKGDIKKVFSIPAGSSLNRRQYVVAWGLVYFLMSEEEFGLKPMLCYLSEVRSGAEADSCFRNCFQHSCEEIETLWQRFLLTL